MVAYNFVKAFAPMVARGAKRQTIRPAGKRHARPGEPVQLYTGMRTRHCRKLVDPDPVCLGCDRIEIHLGIPHPAFIVNGKLLSEHEIGTLALLDGFAGIQYQDEKNHRFIDWSPAQRMRRFFLEMYGARIFIGAVIAWEARP